MILKRESEYKDSPETASDKKRKRNQGIATAALGSAGSLLALNQIGKAQIKAADNSIAKKLLSRVGKVSDKAIKASEQTQKELIRNKVSNRNLKLGALAVGLSLAAGYDVSRRKGRHKSINDDNI